MEERKITMITMDGLSEAEKEILLELGRERKEGDVGIAVYAVRNGAPLFVQDFPLPTDMDKRFEKESPDTLFRGGIVGIMRYRGKFLVVPDERSQWFKPLPAGVARFTEGTDLAATFRRELIEEVFIFSLGRVENASKKERAVRYVPKGLTEDIALYNMALDIAARNTVEIGEITPLGHAFNKTNKAFEAVFAWDLPDDLEKFTISLNEDWFAGGNSGISVYLLNPDGTIAGVFSGQQGIQPISSYGIHETLKKYM